MAELSFDRGWGLGHAQATTWCIVGVFNIFYTRLLKIMVLFVYKTKAAKTRAARPRLRPIPDLQDQDQNQDQFLLV